MISWDCGERKLDSSMLQVWAHWAKDTIEDVQITHPILAADPVTKEPGTVQEYSAPLILRTRKACGDILVWDKGLGI